MSDAPLPPESDKIQLEQGLHEGSAAAEEKGRSAQVTDRERGLGPANMDQEATVEAQRDELERDDPPA